jgi:hypothetical protein
MKLEEIWTGDTVRKDRGLSPPVIVLSETAGA